MQRHYKTPFDIVPEHHSGLASLILAKLEYLQHKFLELQYELHEHREESAQNQATQEKTFIDFLWTLERLDDRLQHDVGRNFTVLQERSWQILVQQTACANHDALREKLFDFIPKQNQSLIDLEQNLLSNNSSFKLRKQNCVTPVITSIPVTSTTSAASTTAKIESGHSSCKDVASNVSGTYLIRAKSGSDPFPVYCEQQQFGGGWLVLQYRYDGSVDFNRNWTEFKNGFGDIKKEYWLGLEKLHQLTSARANELIVELKDFNGTYKYARYDGFEIGSESEQYSLKTLGTYSGTAGDSLEYHKEMKFSTKDRDNDQLSTNCAIDYEGAWWHKGCFHSHLNGRYLNVESNKAMGWYHFQNNPQGMSYSRMMIRSI
ncbi:fibrinogen-like protein A [Anopheles darlingi]|uniref:fibrinogen-like protein A n=1 Tax=Anopheles darlingi TaxID=43151 RepID=UPI00210026B6|nr:fibrinogen-like protein A [Anopheles darlingi]